MDIQRITVIGGQGREGRPEPLARLDLEMGQVLSVVGPTGSGKTALINDIALLANRNTPSGRRVLVNGAVPPETFVDDPASNPIALITQHTTFLSDLPVHRFLATHARVRGADRPELVVAETLEFANQLTGEPVILDAAMTELSGGQTCALLVADAVVIGNEILRLWEYDAAEAEVATEEGMPGGNGDLLQRILLALDGLGAGSEVGSAGPTKQHALLWRRAGHK
jgi:ABC-type lipoprotein export system ATPase subunit